MFILLFVLLVYMYNKLSPKEQYLYNKKRIQEQKQQRLEQLKNGIFQSYNSIKLDDLNPIDSGYSQSGSKCICGKTDIPTNNYLFDHEIIVCLPHRLKHYKGKSFRLGNECIINHWAFDPTIEINERKDIMNKIIDKTKGKILND